MPKKVSPCSKCFNIREVQFHHVCPRRYFGKKNNDSRVLLCNDCHVEIEQIIGGVGKLPTRVYIGIYKDWILGNSPMVIKQKRREAI